MSVDGFNVENYERARAALGPNYLGFVDPALLTEELDIAQTIAAEPDEVETVEVAGPEDVTIEIPSVILTQAQGGANGPSN